MKLENNENIIIINEKYPDFFHSLLLSNNFKLNSNQLEERTIVDWKSIQNKHSMVYYFDNCEEIIRKMLSKTVINNIDLKLYIEFGPNESMIKTDGAYFVNNWEEFVLDYGSLGTTIISESGEYIMEFSDDTNWLLYTNFPMGDENEKDTQIVI